MKTKAILWGIIVMLMLSLLGCMARITDGYAASGTIVDTNGEPIEGVILNFAGERNFSAASTDDAGNWRKSGLLGEVTVTPVHALYEFTPNDRIVTGETEGVDFEGTRKVDVADPVEEIHVVLDQWTAMLVGDDLTGFEDIFGQTVLFLGLEYTQSAIKDVFQGQIDALTYRNYALVDREISVAASGETATMNAVQYGYLDWRPDSGNTGTINVANTVFYEFALEDGNWVIVNITEPVDAGVPHPEDLVNETIDAWEAAFLNEDLAAFDNIFSDPVFMVDRLVDLEELKGIYEGTFDAFDIIRFAITDRELTFSVDMSEATVIAVQDLKMENGDTIEREIGNGFTLERADNAWLIVELWDIIDD